MIPIKYLLISSFSILIIIQLGVLSITASSAKYFKGAKGYDLWKTGVIFSCLGYGFSLFEIITTTQIAKVSLIITLASLFFGMSQVILLIVLLTFKKKIYSKSNIYFLILIAIIYVLLFEYGRLFEDFVFRGSVTSIFYIICDAVGLFILYALKKENNEKFSRLIFITATAFFVNALLSIFRLTYLVTPDFYHLPLTIQNSVFIFILTQIFFTLVFLGVSYFWVEESGAGSKLLSIETEQYKKLLDAKERSLKQLLLTQNSIMLGAHAHVVAHELNQPLASLRLKTDYLKELLTSRTDLREERGLVDSINMEILRTASIVQSIKALMAQENCSTAAFSVDILVMELADAFQHKITTNKIVINLKLNASTFIVADKAELQLLISNLLENAIFALASESTKFSNDFDFNGQVTFETFFKGSDVVIKIIDNGPGLDKEYQERLFELHNSTKPSGTGVGLWLSSMIARRHNGSLIYSDSVPKGATFTLSIPVIHPDF